MSVPLLFAKASGAGNDFVLINNVRGDLDLDFSRLAPTICDRHFGVGGDGLLIVNRSSRVDYEMLYYNADGSFGGMCGNGGRCIARFAMLEDVAGSTQHFEALGHVYTAEVGEESVKLHMKNPEAFQSEILIPLERESHRAYFLNTGAPHAVILCQNLSLVDVRGVGRAIRRHPLFQPDGTNVNFLQLKDGSTVEIRTYERGVEAETLACGTGSVASALVASLHVGFRSPVSVRVRSGEDLLVHFRGTNGNWTDIVLEGSAYILFKGSALYDPIRSKIEVLP